MLLVWSKEQAGVILERKEITKLYHIHIRANNHSLLTSNMSLSVKLPPHKLIRHTKFVRQVGGLKTVFPSMAVSIIYHALK